MKIGIVGGLSKDYKTYLEELTSKVEFISINTENDVVAGLNLLVFTGGADVSPEYYGEQKGKYTSTNRKRDDTEAAIFRIDSKIPKLGICRGSQFLTVMSGGSLIQHVTGHSGLHDIHVYAGKDIPELTFKITSTHHQMMYPFNVPNYKLIAWSKRFRSDVYLNGNNKEKVLINDFLEPEIVYYKDSNSLCIQGHPEMRSCPKGTKEFTLNLIKKYL